MSEVIRCSYLFVASKTGKNDSNNWVRKGYIRVI